MYLSVPFLHVNVQVLVDVGLEDAVKLLGQMEPQCSVFIAGLAVVTYSNQPAAYSRQKHIQP